MSTHEDCYRASLQRVVCAHYELDCVHQRHTMNLHSPMEAEAQRTSCSSSVDGKPRTQWKRCVSSAGDLPEELPALSGGGLGRDTSCLSR